MVSGKKFNSLKEARDYADAKQAEYDGDKNHQKASDKLDKAFGYSRFKVGQKHDYDAPLTVRDTGMFSYKAPKDRPLKQKSWGENPGGRASERLPINETGSFDELPPVNEYRKGGAVPDFAKGGASLPRTKHKWGK